MKAASRTRSRARVVLHDQEPTPADLLEAVADGLSRARRVLPCKFLYDERGARLFDEICTLEAYYPTRTETVILHEHARAISACIGPRARIVELGSGSAAKTRILLDSLARPTGYVPVDISRAQLVEVAVALAEEYPTLQIAPVCADYTAAFTLPAPPAPTRRTVAFFPGSTIGNFEPADAEAFLRRIATLVGAGGGLLIGVDLVKDSSVLEHAYNDPEGVTAAFNLNLLRRINRECRADFDLDAFEHRAIFNREDGRIEMHLVSRREQTVRLPAAANGQRLEFRLGAGEHITTEHSYKYDLARFREMASRAGFRVDRVWTDPQGWFSVQYLTVEVPEEAPRLDRDHIRRASNHG